MLKQRIDIILNSNFTQEEKGSKEFKGDIDENLESFETVQFSNRLNHSSSFSSPKQSGEGLCSLLAEGKTTSCDGGREMDGVWDTKTGANKATDRNMNTEADACVDAVQRNQAAANLFTQKMKDNHRAGLNTLKTTLNTKRAQQLGELKNLRQEKEESGESVLDIERRIHLLTEGMLVCMVDSVVIICGCCFYSCCCVKCISKLQLLQLCGKHILGLKTECRTSHTHKTLPHIRTQSWTKKKRASLRATSADVCWKRAW